MHPECKDKAEEYSLSEVSKGKMPSILWFYRAEFTREPLDLDRTQTDEPMIRANTRRMDLSVLKVAT